MLSTTGMEMVMFKSQLTCLFVLVVAAVILVGSLALAEGSRRDK